jgi:hypothetical protein
MVVRNQERERDKKRNTNKLGREMRKGDEIILKRERQKTVERRKKERGEK